MRAPLFVLALVAVAAPATAEVVASAPGAFEIRHQATIAAPPDKLWAAFSDVARWWHPDHSYSGDSANLRLELRPGGCFCEATPKVGGGVEHLRVAMVEPNKRAILTGGLGPLLYEGVAGTLDVQLKPDGAGTALTLTYRAAGFARANAASLAGPVDKVLGEQVRRLAAVAEGKTP